MSTDPKHLFLAKAVIPSLQEHNRYATVCREGGMELRKYAWGGNTTAEGR